MVQRRTKRSLTLLETLTADNPDIIFVVTMGKEEEITKAMKQAMTDNPAWANLKPYKITA